MTILQKILEHSEIGMTMRYVKIAEHYKVEAAVKFEKYRAVKIQEAEEKMGMVQCRLLHIQEQALFLLPSAIRVMHESIVAGWNVELLA